MSKYRHRTRGAAQDHNIAVVLTLYKKGSQAMLNNKFKYWEGQSLCIRLNYRTGYCTHESVPLCHDLLRLSLCSGLGRVHLPTHVCQRYFGWKEKSKGKVA